MNGYSKMRVKGNPSWQSKSRSMDMSGLSFSPPPEIPKAENGNCSMEGQKRPVVALTRNFSSSSQRFRRDDSKTSSANITTVQAVVRTAFSMRRSSSSNFSDGYWRIHDTEEVIHEEEEGDMRRSSRKKRSKIFRAWKSLFKF